MPLIERMNELTQANNEAAENENIALNKQSLQEDPLSIPEDPIQPLTTGQEQTQKVDQAVNKQMATPFTSTSDLPENPESWSTEYTQMGFLEKAGRSFVRGIGEQVVGGYGDMLQVGGSIIFGMDTANGNMASRWLQEQGDSIAEGTENYLTKDFRDQMENNAWSFSTLMKPDFWSNTVAEGVPLLVEMVMMSKGAGLLTKGTAKSLTKGIGQTGAKLKLGKTAQQSRNLSGAIKKESFKALDDAIELKGKGIAGLVDDAGKLSKGGTAFAEGANDLIAGGLTMNLLAGAMNSAELINENKGLKDENGNLIYSDDELRSMAANSMINNAKYIPIDMLSWGVTYGKQAGLASRFVKNQTNALKKVFTPAQQLKIAGNEFKSVTKPLYRKLFDAAVKGGQKLSSPMLEGFEETFQETFEEYAKKKAKAKIDGISDDMSLKDYWTFYMSKENEQTKIAAFGLGMLGGAGGSYNAKAVQSIKNILNTEAEKATEGYQKSELLKRVVDPKNTDMYKAQQVIIAEQLINNVDSNIDNEVFIEQLVDKGIIDETQAKDLNEQAKTIEEAWEEAKVMNVKGKFAYAYSKQKEAIYNQYLAEQVEASNNRIAGFKEKISDPKLSERLIKEEEEKLAKIQNTVEHALIKENITQQSLISNRVIDGLTPDDKTQFVRDENGDERLMNGLTEKQHNEYYNMSDEEIWAELKKQDALTPSQDTRNAISKFTDFGKNIFKKSKEKEDVKKENLTDEEIAQKKKDDVAPEREAEITPEDEVLEKNDTFKSFIEKAKITGEEEISKIKKDVSDFFNGLSEMDFKNDDYILADEINKLPDGNVKTFLQQVDKQGIIGTLKTKFEDVAEKVKTKVNEAKAKVEKEKIAKEKQDRENEIKEDDSYEDRLRAAKKKKGFNKKLFDAFEKAFDNQTEIQFEGEEKKRAIKSTKERNALQSNEELNVEYSKKPLRSKEGNIVNQKERLGTYIDHTNINGYKSHKQWLESHVGVYHKGQDPLLQAVAINNYNRTNGLASRVLPLTNLYQALGERTVGYSIGNAVFIEEGFWDQDEIFMHEHAHIYYAVSGNNQETKDVIAEARKNKELVDAIENNYIDEILYEIPKAIYGYKKGQIVKPADFKAKTQEDIDFIINRFKLKRLPDSEQDMINEELFVNYLQGPLSKEFDKFFNPKLDYNRQKNSKKWWQFFKAKNKNADDLVNSLDNKKINITHADFRESLGNKDVSVNGRKAVLTEMAEENQSTHETYRDKFRKSLQKYENENSYVPDQLNNIIRDRILDSKKYKDLFVEIEKNIRFGEVLEDGLADHTDIEEETSIDHLGSMYSKDYQSTESRAGILIQLFVREFQNKQIDSGVDPTKVLTEDFFKSTIMNLAKEKTNPFEFMRIVFNPAESNVVGNEFVKFLNLFGDDKYAVLQAMHMIYRNTTTLNVISQEIKNNQFLVHDRFTSKEYDQIPFVVDQFYNMMDINENFRNIYEQILLQNISNEDANTFLNFFRANKFLHIPEIIDGGVMIHKGELMPIVNYFAKLYNEANTNQLKSSNANTEPFNVMEFVQDILITSRRYSARAVVTTPKAGVGAPAKQISFAFAREIEAMQNDLMGGMDKLDFVNKWSRNKKAISEKLKYDFVNPLIEHIYDKYSNEKILPNLNMINGLVVNVDDSGNQNVEPYKDGISTSLTTQDLLRFANGNNQYLTTTNTLAESRRLLAIHMPKHDSTGILISDNRIQNQGNGKKLLNMAYSIYAQSYDNSGEDFLSEKEYVKAYAESVKELRRRLNYDKTNLGYKVLEEKYYKDGILNAAGNKLTADYVLSTMLNKSAVHNIFTPSVPVDSIIKRNKQNGSPVMTLSPTLRFEPMFIGKDIQIEYDENGNPNEYLENDSGDYVLDIHAKKIEDLGRILTPFNKSYKILNAHVENDNPNFKDKYVNLKGYTTILSKELIEKYPRYRPIYEAMMQRHKKFTDWASKNNLQESEFFGDGGFDYIVFATPFSSEKGSMFSKEQLERLDGTSEKEGLLSVNTLQDEKAMEGYHKVHDAFNYDKEGNFIGFNGSNFGVQMVFDQEKKRAPVPIQTIQGIETALSTAGRMDMLDSILGPFYKATRNNFNRRFDSRTTNVNDLSEYVLSRANKVLIDPNQRYLLEQSGPSILHPGVSEFTKNQVKKDAIQSGNNLVGHGSILQQKSAAIVKIGNLRIPDNRGFRLRSYRTVNTIRNSIREKVVMPVEGILPKFMEDSHRARKYFASKEAMKNELFQEGFLKEFNLWNADKKIKQENIDHFIKLHTVIENGVTKYYIPGEKVMITRVPSSSPAFTGIMEVVDFDPTGAANIMIPGEFKDVIGSDDDGDSIFVNSKYKNIDGKIRDKDTYKAYNDFIDNTIKAWLDPEIHKIINKPLDPVNQTEDTLNKLDVFLNKTTKKKLPFTPQWEEGNFDNSLGARQTLGQAFIYKKIYDIFAAYDTKTVIDKRDKLKIFENNRIKSIQTTPAFITFQNYGSTTGMNTHQNIDNKNVNILGTKKLPQHHRSHVMNMLTQFILDSTNNGFADRYNINSRNVHIPFGLAAVGFDLEDVYVFMNHPTSLKYFEALTDAKNPFMDYQSKKQIISSLRTDIKSNNYDKTNLSFNVNAKSSDFTSAENEHGVLNIIEYLNLMETHVNTLNRIYKGHKDISADPRIIKKQIEDVNKLVNNQISFQPVFEFSEEFRNSAQLKNLLETAEELRSVLQNMDIADNEVNEKLLTDSLNATKSFDITEALTSRYSEGIQLNALGKMFGINNQYTAQDLKNMTKDLRDRLRTFREEDPANADNLFLKEILEIGPKAGNFEESGDLEVGKNSKAMSYSFTEEQRLKYANAFNELPVDIKEMIIVSDLVSNGWKGKRSLLDVIGKDLTAAINNEAGIVNANIDNFKKTKDQLQDVLLLKEMKHDNPGFDKIWITPDNNQREKGYRTEHYMNRAIALLTPTDINTLRDNKKIVHIYIKNNNAKQPLADYFIEIDQFTAAEEKEATERAREMRNNKTDEKIYYSTIDHLRAKIGANKKAKFVELRGTRAGDEEIIAIPDATKKKPYTLRDILSKGESEITVKKKVGRAMRVDFENFQGPNHLNKEEFIRAQEYKYNVSDAAKEKAYARYERDKTEAESIYEENTKEKLATYSDEVLLEKYKEYGKKDIYAFSNIMVPLLLEINKRSSAEQSKLTGRTETGHDIKVLQAYMQTNNITATHPATQAVARQLEIEYKKFIDEKKKYVRKLNAVTDRLYDEKFKDKISSFAYVNKVYRAIKTLFSDRKNVYEKLYGNIIDVDEGLDARGKYAKTIRLLSPKVLEGKLKAGEITQNEFDFAKVYREITTELGHKEPDFIPKVAMGKMEYFSSRGMLGLMTSSVEEDRAIYDVRMKFQDEVLSFKEIEDFYRSIAKNSFKNMLDYRKHKKNAQKLLKQGINEDGSPITIDDISNNTMLGFGMNDKFANGGAVDQSIMTTDLNKALYSYIHNQLFVNGNDKFKGFLKLQSLVDGLLLHNRSKGYKNQNKFVKGVYKDYFLKGVRLASNTPADKVIDALVKGNFYYILGYKALALQKGVYAIGNMVVGKYHNIKHLGGKAWIKGELRFWGLTKDGSLGVKKSRGILDTLNYSDYNIYDEVEMEKQQGIGKVFSDLALLPMDYSEKWIQGVQFLGQLSNEEWSRFDENGKYKPGAEPISLEKLAILENEVKRTQGKGYTPTDQRLIQQYSWGKMIMQFSRFIPTMIHDRFAKEDVDIYGQEHIGSLRAVYDVIHRVITGELSPRDFVAYRNSLSPGMTKQLDAGLRGMAMASVGIFLGSTFDINWMKEMTADANYVINPSKMEWKMMPSLIRTTSNAVGL